MPLELARLKVQNLVSVWQERLGYRLLLELVDHAAISPLLAHVAVFELFYLVVAKVLQVHHAIRGMLPASGHLQKS